MPVFSTAKLIAAGVVALAFAALVIAVLWYRSAAIENEAKFEAEKVQTQIAVEANKKQEIVIQRITEQRAADDKVIADFTAAMQTISSQSDEVKQSIVNLERGNNEVRTYLATRVPTDLASLLARKVKRSTSAGNTRQPGTGRTNRAVSPPGR